MRDERRRRRRRAHASIMARDHSASGRSSMISPTNLLAAEPRAGVARDHLARNAGDRCAAFACVAARVTAVRGSAISRLISAVGRGVVVMSWRGRAPEPQAELQHVERVVGLAPLGELVAPGRVELRPAQALRILGRERLRDRAVRPFQPPPRRRSTPAARARGASAQQPGRALDHHLAHVVLGLADQRDAAVRRVRVRRQAERQRAHELRAEPRLAGAAPAEREPRGPRAAVVGGRRRLLMRMRERDEVAVERHPPAQVRHLRQRRPAVPACEEQPQCGAQVRDGIHRCRRGMS